MVANRRQRLAEESKVASLSEKFQKEKMKVDNRYWNNIV